MGNITLNKQATASNSILPYVPSRAVDGSQSPSSRWVSDSVPAWLTVDLQNNFWVNQWTAILMGSVGWTPGYNIQNFKLQGSNDNINWFDMDNVSNNTANQINRTFAPMLARFLRVYITNGLAVNNRVASIVDFQAFEPDTAPFLSSLVPSVGALAPAFSNRNFSYSIQVANEISNIAFTPTALQPNMEVRVNGDVVVSGSPSQQVNLNVGTTTVYITVKSTDGAMLTTYTVNVTRAAIANLYLDSVVFKYTGRGLPEGSTTITMVDTQTDYPVNIPTNYTAATATPFARDTSVTILVNNVPQRSGDTSASIPLPTTGTVNVTIMVRSPDGTASRTYTFGLWKVSI